MCLGSGGPAYVYKEPKKKEWESEFKAPPDTVNNKLLSDEGNYSQEATKDLDPKNPERKPQSEKQTTS